MPNSKISELKEAFALRSENILDSFPTQAQISGHGNGDNNASLIIARANSHNEKISYNHLKSSLLDKSVLLTGNQLISGQKTFTDPCTFLSRTNINEIFDETQTGDISGNIFVGTSGLFQKIGISNIFHERDGEPSYTLHASGDSCFLGGITNTGYHRHIGNIYRIGDSNLLGDFNITGDSWRIGDVDMKGDFYISGNFFTQIGDSTRSGDQLVIGDITHTGYHRQKGDFYRIGESDFIGDFSVTGDSLMVGDIKMEGNYYLTGDFTQTGNSTIFGDERVTGDVHVGEYIYHYQDEDTFIKLEEDQISLSVNAHSEILISESNNDFISFSTSGEEQMRIDNSGFVGINTVDTLGELSVTGDSFLENIFVYDEFAKKFNKVYGGDDETISFSTPIKGGKKRYLIDLPKTFKEKPILSVSLESCDGNVILPFILQDANRYEFYIQFHRNLPNTKYIVRTTALCSSVMQNKNELNYKNFPYCSSMDPGANRHGMQRFYFTPAQDSATHEIHFPLIYENIPNISINVEGPGFVVPYVVSNITKESFTLKLGAKLTKNHVVHCCSSEPGFHRLGQKLIYNAQWFEDQGDYLSFREFHPGNGFYRPEFVTSLPALELWELNSISGTIKPRCEPYASEDAVPYFFERTGNYLTTP